MMKLILSYKTEIIIFLAALVFYSINLGGVPLLDPDEPVYGQTAREMVLTGSWLTPKLNGLLWFDKPPMYFWLSALSYNVFGINEFAARFPSALMAAMTLMVVFAWAKKISGHNCAIFSAITLMTSLLFAFIARSAVTDMTLCFFMTLSFYMIFLAIESEKSAEKFKYINWFYFICGFSVLTKGPVGIVLPFLIIIPYLVFTQKFDMITRLISLTGIICFSISAMPWYLAMLFLHKMQFFNTFIGYHNLIRFLEPEHVGTQKTWFYLPVLILGFFPHLYALGDILWRLAAGFFKFIYFAAIKNYSTGGKNRQTPAGNCAGGFFVTKFLSNGAYSVTLIVTIILTSALFVYLKDKFNEFLKRKNEKRQGSGTLKTDETAEPPKCRLDYIKNTYYKVLADPEKKLFLIFIIFGIFGFFSISKTKLVTYILPLFPALAIIIGTFYSSLISSPNLERVNSYPGIFLKSLIGFALFYVFYKVAPSKLLIDNTQVFKLLYFISALFVITTLFTALLKKYDKLFWCDTILMLIFLLTINFGLLPEARPLYSAVDICGKIEKVIAPGDRLAYFSKTPSVLFYSSRTVEHLPDLRRINLYFSQKDHKNYLIMLTSDYEKYRDKINVHYTYGDKGGKYIYLYN